MNMRSLTIALLGTLIASPVLATPQQMDPAMHMSSMDAMSAKPVDAQGVGIVKAIDTAKGTITLQHEAIASIHWPAMTMAFTVATPDLLKAAMVGDSVRFTVHPDGMNGTVTAIKPIQAMTHAVRR